MEDWQEKLSADNENCAWAAKAINDIDGVSVMSPPDTNMCYFSLDPSITGLETADGPTDKHLTYKKLCEIMRQEYDVIISPRPTNDAVRIVTHRDVSRSELEFFVEKL